MADERRTDIVITYGQSRYVIEIYSMKKGYLLIYDFNKNKTYKEEDMTFGDKEIFAVWV